MDYVTVFGKDSCLLGIAGLPAESDDEVCLSIVRHAECTGSLVWRVLDIGTTGDVVLVEIWGRGAGHKVLYACALCTGDGRGSRETEGSCDKCGEGEETRSNHICDEAED